MAKTPRSRKIIEAVVNDAIAKGAEVITEVPAVTTTRVADLRPGDVVVRDRQDQPCLPTEVLHLEADPIWAGDLRVTFTDGHNPHFDPEATFGVLTSQRTV
jgi:hypothetical protein